MSENFEENGLDEKPDVDMNENPSLFSLNEMKIHKKIELYPSEVVEKPPSVIIDIQDKNQNKENIVQLEENLTEAQLNEDRPLRDLLEKTVNETLLEPNIALFLIYFYNLKNEKQAFDYISTDKFQKYPHPFIPNERANTPLNCVICDKEKKDHHDIQESDHFRAMAIFNSVAQLKAEDLKTFRHEDYQLITCQICYSYIPKNLIFNYQNVPHEICLECLNEYLVIEILNNKVLNMKCPHCSTLLSEEVIKQSVSESMFLKYQKFVENHRILTDPMLRFCPNCPQTIKLNKLEDEQASCLNCKTEICTKCNRVFHKKQSCQSVMEAELKSYTCKKEVQRCPKCKILVEKMEGCNHMTCFVCHYEFCWLCRGAYTSVHFFPLNPLGCPGLQSVKTKINKWHCLKIYLIRFLCLIGCVLLLPFAIILYLPIIFFINCMDTRCYRRNIRYNAFLTVIFIIFLILLCIILEPIFLVIEAVAAIPVGLYLLVEYVKERRGRNRKVVLNRIRSEDDRLRVEVDMFRSQQIF